VFALGSLFCASVNLFVGEYLRTLWGDQVCCLVVEVSVVLYFQYVVFRVYGFAWCHVCVFLVCRSPSFGDASPDACVGGNCLIVGGFSCCEVFMVGIYFPFLVDCLCCGCDRFWQLCVLLGCG
jgi:hypothetical protein